MNLVSRNSEHLLKLHHLGNRAFLGSGMKTKIGRLPALATGNSVMLRNPTSYNKVPGGLTVRKWATERFICVPRICLLISGQNEALGNANRFIKKSWRKTFKTNQCFYSVYCSSLSTAARDFHWNAIKSICTKQSKTLWEKNEMVCHI